MKKLLYIALLLPTLVFGQSTNQNYIKTRTYKKASTESGFDISNPAHVATNVTYVDGLGRPMQQVAHKQSETGTDIVTPITYDAFGRQPHDHLPKPMTTSNMLFADNTTLINTPGNYYTTNFPNDAGHLFSEKRLESSPLNRVLEQGAPGMDWAVDLIGDADHTVKYGYHTNIANEVRLIKATATWNAATMLYNTAPVSNGFYPANQLNKSVIKDENWKPNLIPDSKSGITEEFKNKDGKVVLKRTYNEGISHDTYYIYDQFGNLTYVLPPQANGSTAALSELCYQYKYDHRNRLVEKKLPGKQWEFLVYDKLDRVVATGPAFTPFGGAPQGWMITRYDALSRPALTGWYPATSFTSTTRKTLQDSYNGQVVNAVKGSSTVDNIAVGYASITLPAGFKLLTASYYDDYNFPAAPTSFSVLLDNNEEQAYYNNSNRKPKGVATGSWTRVLTTPSSTLGQLSYTLYDHKARPVRTHTSNHLGGYTYVDTKLDFTGKPLYAVTHHKRSAGGELVTREEFAYTAQERLLSHDHRITVQGQSGPFERLSLNEYDELGKLKSKRVGGVNNPAGIQKVDYSYNIRGWLTGINNTQDLSETGFPTDLFAFKIGYNEVEGMSTPLYNGNIGETYWKTYPENVMRKYSYEYDDLNRLKVGQYQKPGLTQAYTRAYDEEVSYDKNGNILSLKRNGYQDNNYGDYYPIDELQYKYVNNRLDVVIDHSNSIDGFKDGQNPDGNDKPDYFYDANGNMFQDWNKGIKNIDYNHLNLPTRIEFVTLNGNEKSITYLYNALGAKLEKKVKDSPSAVQNTEYLDGFQYVDGSLQFFPTAEGYVSVTDNTKFNYVYNYTDHLGNIRLSYSQEKPGYPAEKLEENHYYPFGMKHQNYGTQKNNYGTDEAGGIFAVLKPVDRNKYQYKYNGKEYQDELLLNWYNYGARNYDPAIGRWMNIDPLAEISRRWSPYSYCYDNPLRFVDPDGMKADDWRNKNNKPVYDAKKQEYTKYATAQDKKFGEALRNSGPEGAKQFDALTKSDAKIKVDFQEGTGVLPTQMGHTEIDSYGTNDKGNVYLKEATIEIYLGSVSLTKDMIMSGEMNPKDYQLSGLRGDNVDIIKSNDVSEFDIAVSVLGHEIAHTDQSNVATKVAADERGGKEEPGLDTELLPTKTSNTILNDLIKK